MTFSPSRSLSCQLAMDGLTVVAAVLVIAGLNAQTQDQREPIEIGERRVVHSRVLGEDRTALIALPAGYNRTQERFATLYVLDGGAHFLDVAGLTRVLAARQRMPPVLVVALTNSNRSRDLTPPSDRLYPSQSREGGADRLLEFIAEELIPWVESEYRTRPLRLLAGHSLGGLFGLYTVLEKPGLFRGVITASASLQYHDQELVRRFDDFLAERQDEKISLYMTAGDESSGLVAGNLRLASLLTEKAPPTLQWHFEQMLEETHMTIPHLTFYRGLERIFVGWSVVDPVSVYDAGGLEALEEKYAETRRNFGYGPGPRTPAFMDWFTQLLYAGRVEEAEELLEQIQRKDDVPLAAWRILATSFDRAGDETNAVKYWQRLLELDPDHKGAKDRLSGR